MDRITWINHAGFIIETGDIRLVSDPWLSGHAFNNGWALHSPTRLTGDELAGVTHIWLSHEHSDHFSPASLRLIPEDRRRAIPLLYQKTLDGRVLDYCRKLGFDCVELAPGRFHDLSGDVRVRCEAFGNGDSWLLVETPERRYLNLNDCPARSDAEINAIGKITGPIDVLLTQFSYAGWVGNPDDEAYRASEAHINLQQIVRQVQLLKPAWTVPCASFIYFCHDENFHANAGSNEIGAVTRTLQAESETQVAVLYPGDTWAVGGTWDNDAAIARYRADRAAAMAAAPVTSPVVELDRLTQEAQTYCRNLRQANQLAWLRPLAWLGFLQPAHIFLTDLGHAVRFGMFEGLSRSNLAEDKCDIAMSSDSLSYCFRFLWGHSALQINGRFREPAGGRGRGYFMRQFVIGLDNNMGRHFPRDTLGYYLRRHLARFGLAPAAGETGPG